MPQSVPWVDIISTSISAVALSVSLFTFYITKLRSFKGYVVPASKISLTWFVVGEEDVPGIILECQFINQGAKPGKIEDVVIGLYNTDQGGSSPYLPFLIINGSIDVYVEEGEQKQSLSDFSSIWLQPDENRHVPIFFKAQTSEINLFEDCTYQLRMQYSGDNIRKVVKRKEMKWARSPAAYNFRISKEVLSAWKNHHTIRLESVELTENRKDAYHLGDSLVL